VQWAVIYICEAHASDVWPLKFSFERPRPTSLAARTQYARECSLEHGFDAAGFRVLCDGMEDSFNAEFGAWPTSYYLLDQRGELLFVGEPERGEYGYDVRRFIDAVRHAVRRLDMK